MPHGSLGNLALEDFARAAAAALETERNFRKIIGHEHLWMLKAALDEGRLSGEKSLHPIDEDRVAA